MKNSQETPKKIVFAPHKGPIKPIGALLFLFFGLLTGVSFLDYDPKQSGWVTTAAEGYRPNLVGKIGATLAFWFLYWFGIAIWLIPVFLFWSSGLFFFRLAHTLRWWKALLMSMAILSGAALANMAEALLLSVHFVEKLPYNYFPNGLGGSVGAWLFSDCLVDYLGSFGSSISLLFVHLLSLVGVFIERPGKIQEWMVRVFRRWQKSRRESIPVPASTPPPKKRPKQRETKAKTEGECKSLKIISPEKEPRSVACVPRKQGGYLFPSLTLLNESKEITAPIEMDHEDVVGALVRTLDEFGVKVTPTEVHAGPVVTRYEVVPAPGVRVEKIVNLDKNIALGLKALAVRILAPVPGKGTVGIEVPNRKPQPVCLRGILESRAWTDSKAEIPIALGKDVTGKAIVTDLTRMPHMLIAGSTGSGKTVCINAIIASLLYRVSPEDLRFIMVDPKIVELQCYNSLPHLLIPVVTEPKKVPGALKWLISEMERRYQIFAQVGARNIAGFNAKILKDKEEQVRAKVLETEMSPEERVAVSSVTVSRNRELKVPEKKLPYIVCIIDELADLMMVAPADIETAVARLAQLARAAGIHLILATQRPSVNVITGVIKANLPCRIAFKVASKVDSRTILDVGGADTLIGRGDMLFNPPGTSTLVRVQGSHISDGEINQLVDFLKQNGPPVFAREVQEQIENAESGDQNTDSSWDDELVPSAIDILRATKRASTSFLQRRLKIGYNRAARIMEILEQEGIVGPENGALPREILKDLDVF